MTFSLVQAARRLSGVVVLAALLGEAFPPSVFPHWVHRIQFRCYVCHSALFEMRQGANQVTMEKIGEGQFCGACHDGQTAFDVEFDTCTRCHKEPDE